MNYIGKEAAITPHRGGEFLVYEWKGLRRQIFARVGPNTAGCELLIHRQTAGHLSCLPLN